MFLYIKKNFFRPLTVRSMLSSRRLLLQLVGAFFSHGVFLRLLTAGALTFAAEKGVGELIDSVVGPIYARELMLTVAACVLFMAVVRGVGRLNPIFSLRRQEERVTWSQICVLVAFGLWLIAIIHIWDLYNTGGMLPVAIVGGVLSVMFQDTIKSVVAFLYVRLNHLLAIGDWIEIPSQNVDGMVRTITLTSVTVENWDTTLSTFPTYLLQSSHFKNLQQMVDGKTYGRRMQRTFIVDTGWIAPVGPDDARRIAAVLGPDDHFAGEVLEARVRATDGRVLNAELFRLYIHHWLMNHPHISRKPRLVVRWLEQQSEGLPLQVYTYITDSSLEAYEWQQSAIIEHIIASMAVFNLQLYQSPSGYDASNGNIYLTDHEADYKHHDNGPQRETL